MINRCDPEGLLESGAPDDEYDPEVGELAALVHGDTTITTSAVAAVFDNWFGDSLWTAQRPGEVAKVAADLEKMRRSIAGTAEP
ncbi:hypothetical protein Ssi02_13390 [Sinosporangium siamense]|uniref:Uncharacterized protein n=1 Tax=Sinosporangium siamense TaxID=1367973 RepID=A0A919RC04_9ACTN|nr:hypothetical protein Ssi02_13390 [Sinosporangium siamense]